MFTLESFQTTLAAGNRDFRQTDLSTKPGRANPVDALGGWARAKFWELCQNCAVSPSFGLEVHR